MQRGAVHLVVNTSQVSCASVYVWCQGDFRYYMDMNQDVRTKIESPLAESCAQHLLAQECPLQGHMIEIS